MKLFIARMLNRSINYHV